jgi:ribosomal protein S18 acetylase RimI-like enzyme
MKSNIRIVKVEKKTRQQQCLSFLKNSGVCNMYILEGMKVHHPHFHNYCLSVDDRIAGVLHTKNSSYLHLHIDPETDRSVAQELVAFIAKRFPTFEMLFGDESSVSAYFSCHGTTPRSTMRFIFMETDERRFHPRLRFRGKTPVPADASLLVPLQIKYEIEEVGAMRSQIDSKKVLRVMASRIRRGEVSAIYNSKTPVALAGVNARFENCCQIGSVFVLPEFRGRGYGSSVVSYHVGRMIKRYDRIVLFVHERNGAAIHVYDTLGFKERGSLIQAYR